MMALPVAPGVTIFVLGVAFPRDEVNSAPE